MDYIKTTSKVPKLTELPLPEKIIKIKEVIPEKKIKINYYILFNLFVFILFILFMWFFLSNCKKDGVFRVKDNNTFLEGYSFSR